MIGIGTTRRMKRRGRWATALVVDALKISVFLEGVLALVAVLFFAVSYIRGVV